MQDPDLTGKTILITAGEFAGKEGVCLGRSSADDGRWAVSPDSSERILDLHFAAEFGVLLNRGQEPGKN